MKRLNKSMLSGPLLPNIISYTIPIILTSVLQLLFNAADLVVVGRFRGSLSVAAVSATGALINLIVQLLFGLSVGAGVCVAHDIGAKDDEGVQKTVHTAVITALGAGVIVTTLGFLLTRPLLILMGTDESVLPEATKYITAYVCGMPANMLYNYCASVLRAKGDTVRPLIFLSIAGVANVLFNLFAVLVLRWGAMGVGAAK